MSRISIGENVVEEKKALPVPSGSGVKLGDIDYCTFMVVSRSAWHHSL